MVTNNNSSIFIFLLLCTTLTLLHVKAAILSRFDFVNGATNSYMYTARNPVGLSFSLNQLQKQLDNQLFQNYLMNSNLYGQWANNFQVIAHNPGGYKYNCSFMQSLYPNTTLNCTFDISNTTFIKTLGSFIWNTTNYVAFSFGWDNEGANFTNKTYMNQTFVPFVRSLFAASKYQQSMIEVADKADTWNSTGFRYNYSSTDPAKDCNALNQFLYIYYTSPGVTESASSKWYDQMSNINYLCGIFTMRGTVFPNASSLTVANLMSDNYTYQYLRNRLKINGTDYTRQLSSSYVSFNELRLIDDPSANNTAADTFAAGLWAIDFFMEWNLLGGFRLNFFSPIIQASKQSVLGKAPTYSPSAIYTGLLFALIANQQSPWLIRPAAVAGTSSNIKAYGLQNYDNYGVLILNKDTNINASGEVQVKLVSLSGVNCIYYSADSLNSTSSGTIGGVSFVPNNADPVGNFTIKSVASDGSGVYNIPLNYSQAVLCFTIPQRSYYYFPTGTSLSEKWFKMGLLLMLLFIVLL